MQKLLRSNLHLKSNSYNSNDLEFLVSGVFSMNMVQKQRKTAI